MPGYRLVVAAVSPAPQGLHTLRAAARIAAGSRATLVVYHAVDTAGIPLPPDSPLYAEVLREMRERASRILEAARAIAESMGVERVVTVKLEGDPVDGLWEALRRAGGAPDLIVVGRPRRPPALPGSRVVRVIRGAPSAVLVAPRTSPSP